MLRADTIPRPAGRQPAGRVDTSCPGRASLGARSGTGCWWLVARRILSVGPGSERTRRVSSRWSPGRSAHTAFPPAAPQVGACAPRSSRRSPSGVRVPHSLPLVPASQRARRILYGRSLARSARASLSPAGPPPGARAPRFVQGSPPESARAPGSSARARPPFARGFRSRAPSSGHARRRIRMGSGIGGAAPALACVCSREGPDALGQGTTRSGMAMTRSGMATTRSHMGQSSSGMATTRSSAARSCSGMGNTCSGALQRFRAPFRTRSRCGWSSSATRRAAPPRGGAAPPRGEQLGHRAHAVGPLPTCSDRFPTSGERCNFSGAFHRLPVPSPSVVAVSLGSRQRGPRCHAGSPRNRPVPSFCFSRFGRNLRL